LAIATANTFAVVPKGASIFTWINGATVTASDQTVGLVGVEAFVQATIFLNVTAASGTSPTLDVYLQKLLPDKLTWHDIAHFTQATGTGKRVMSIVSGGNKEEAQQTGALAAATVNSVAIGSKWRISAVVAGTNPSFTFSLHVEGLV
jgi:hypothetical protein